MRIRPEQIPPRLAQLAPLYLLSSNEPLLVDEALEAFRERARAAGLEDRESWVVEKGFNWNQLQGSLGNLSLFSAGKLVELRLPNGTPGDEGSREIRALAGRPADGNVVVIVTPQLPRKVAESAWVKAAAAAGAWFELPAPGLDDLPDWIHRRLKAAGLSADDEGLALIAARVEGNLLAARQEVEKLALLYPAGTALTADQVRDAVADGARFDVFQLTDAALDGDLPRAVRILEGLREEGEAAPLVLWALARDIQTLVDAAGRAAGGLPLPRALAAAGIWQSRSERFLGALRRRRAGGMSGLLAMTAAADRVVKGAQPGEPWQALLELVMALGGHASLRAELA